MERLLPLERVKEVTGCSRSGIYRDPTFPKPVKLSPRRVAWVEGEVQNWIRSRIEERVAA